jgi:hypothetical protein
MDIHWSEVMKLAEKYGFIIQAYGGTAILATHENQMNGKCLKELGYPECESGCQRCYLTK